MAGGFEGSFSDYLLNGGERAIRQGEGCRAGTGSGIGKLTFLANCTECLTGNDVTGCQRRFKRLAAGIQNGLEWLWETVGAGPVERRRLFYNNESGTKFRAAPAQCQARLFLWVLENRKGRDDVAL